METNFGWKAFVIFLMAVLVITSSMYALPLYGVYAQRLKGQAELQRAESNRQIKVREAQAAFDAADLTAKAEIRRAQGVAEANKIIADSLGGSEGYLRWRYIEMLENTSQGGRDVIYIPTEAGLPILEAGKRKSRESSEITQKDERGAQSKQEQRSK